MKNIKKFFTKIKNRLNRYKQKLNRKIMSKEEVESDRKKISRIKHR